VTTGEKDASPRNSKALARFGAWLGVKRNFIVYSIFGFGGLLYVILFIWLRIGCGIGGPLFWLFMAVVVAIGGYAWGLIMWQFFEVKRREWQGRKP
jgi:hypothetical protein